MNLLETTTRPLKLASTENYQVMTETGVFLVPIQIYSPTLDIYRSSHFRTDYLVNFISDRYLTGF